jgi:tetratricopeptide (TPR) repeat protein
MYRAQYGDILLQLGEYDKAIVQYEQALKVDPNFDFALRNCAAAYKNKVALIQKKQIETGKNEPQEYINDLEKSIEYFEKCRKTPRFMNDYEVLGELAQLYFVNNKVDKVKEMAAELEALDPLVKQEDKEKYLYVLLKVYDSYLKNEKKMKEIQEKINSLNHK